MAPCLGPVTSTVAGPGYYKALLLIHNRAVVGEQLSLSGFEKLDPHTDT